MDAVQSIYDIFYSTGKIGSVVQHMQKVMQRIDLHIGELKMSCRNVDWNGWLKCDGRVLAVAEYPELYAVVGNTFGGDIVAGTFALPDARSKVLGAIGQSVGLSSRVMGESVGAETHTLDVTQMPNHTHMGATNPSGTHSHGITDPGHTHTQTTINDDFNSSGATPPGFTADSAGIRTWSNINSSATNITINTDGSHTHAFETAAVGSGLPHNNMQPTLFVGNVFIYSGVFQEVI